LPHAHCLCDVAMDMLISSHLLDQILAHAAQTPNLEVCGLMFGDEQKISAIEPTVNVHPNPAGHFEVDPARLIAAHRQERGGGPRLIGHYHSHPSGDVMPSLEDAAASVPGQYWLIVAGDKAGLFRAEARGPIATAFHPVLLHLLG